MNKDTLKELAAIRRALIKLTMAQNDAKNRQSIRRAAEAVKDAILDGRGA